MVGERLEVGDEKGLMMFVLSATRVRSDPA
jgi:hypothetical protein